MFDKEQEKKIVLELRINKPVDWTLFEFYPTVRYMGDRKFFIE